jgi:hypothetical protein
MSFVGALIIAIGITITIIGGCLIHVAGFFDGSYLPYTILPIGILVLLSGILIYFSANRLLRKIGYILLGTTVFLIAVFSMYVFSHMRR